MDEQLVLPENLEQILGVDNEFYAALAVHCLSTLGRLNSEAKKQNREFLVDYLVALATPSRLPSVREEMRFSKILHDYDEQAAAQLDRVGNSQF